MKKISEKYFYTNILPKSYENPDGRTTVDRDDQRPLLISISSLRPQSSNFVHGRRPIFSRISEILGCLLVFFRKCTTHWIEKGRDGFKRVVPEDPRESLGQRQARPEQVPPSSGARQGEVTVYREYKYVVRCLRDVNHSDYYKHYESYRHFNR